MKYAHPNCCVTRESSIFAKFKISPLTLGSLSAIWQVLVCSYLLRFREQRRKSGVVLGERPVHCPDSLIPPYNVNKGNEADHSVPAWVVGTLPPKIFVSRVTRRDTKIPWILGIYALLFFSVYVCSGNQLPRPWSALSKPSNTEVHLWVWMLFFKHVQILRGKEL